jgi:lipopolysaccharide/colanic/teichoic acid biosynthesis glycosyltransferase
LDELPQLVNVLRGDMSLVGPRPDLPEFYETLGPEQRLIVALRPGVTGWATLQFRDEEGYLASVPEEQVADYYVSTLFPTKVQLALDYAQRATFLTDLGIIVRTIIGT